MGFLLHGGEREGMPCRVIMSGDADWQADLERWLEPS